MPQPSITEVVRKAKGDLEGALADYSEAIRIKPDYTNAFYNRAVVFFGKGSYEAAVADFQKYLDTGGGVRYGDQQGVEQRIRDLAKKAKAELTKGETE